MKNILIILSVVIVSAGLAMVGYGYWQSKQPVLVTDCQLHIPKEGAISDQGLYFTGCDFVWECEQLSKQNSKDMCLFDLARKSSDQEICKKITNKTEKKWCNNIFEAKVE